MSKDNEDQVAVFDGLDFTTTHEQSIKRMISDYGDPPETVRFTSLVTKINRRDKEQTRELLITDKAIYNLKPGEHSKPKRRIDLKRIAFMSLSQLSDEFVLHVLEEYDYRFKSPKKNVIAETMKSIHKSRFGTSFKVVYKSEDVLKDFALTKKEAKLQTREERMRRRALLLEDVPDDDSDKEDSVSESPSDATRSLLKTEKQVTLDSFEFLKVIGRGSFGKVMQVREKKTGEIYAMKILKKSAIIARNQVEHTRAERKILEALQHPFLMGLQYAFQSKGKLYFVLNYYRGGELFYHLKQRRRFTEDETRLFIGEVALALGHLHKLDVVYRDLKPENVLLDHTGHLCLTDFGLSKDLTPENLTAHTFCGTPEYLAPEIIMGYGHGKEVDWWSLGILLYELTVGIPPFYSQNVKDMYEKIQRGVLRFPPFLSPECKSLIVKLLNRDPAKRLGGGTDDVEQIKNHPFFASMDWEKLYRKEIEPTYKPTVKGPEDTSLFDTEFTNEPVVDSFVADSDLVKEDVFQGFTFVDRPNM
eukprot:168603_1